jgi:hypothetical protein
MKERDDIAELAFRQVRKCRHATFDNSLAYNWPDGAAVIVVAYYRRAREVRRARSFCIVSVAEAASGLELSLPSLDCGHVFDRTTLFDGLMCGLFLRTGESYENDGEKKRAHKSHQS